MDGNNFENNGQNFQENSGGGQYGNGQNAGGANGQYGNGQNAGGANGQYGNYQNAGGTNGQYGNYQNNGGTNGQYGGYQNNVGPGNPYGNYQNNMANIPYNPPDMNGMGNNKANGLQVAGLICGILAICACWCYGIISIILAIAGIICSVIGNGRNKHGIGIAGLICSIIGLLLGIAAAIYFAWVVKYMSEMGLFDKYFYY